MQYFQAPLIRPQTEDAPQKTGHSLIKAAGTF